MRPMALVGRQHPALHRPADPVEDVTDEKIHDLASRMLATCRVKGGLAIAAPQVGVSLAVVVKFDGICVVNPRVEIADDAEWELNDEGCLSLPGRTYLVNRATTCTVSGWSVTGVEVTENEEGLMARLWQHELDHLSGVLISGVGREQRGRRSVSF